MAKRKTRAKRVVYLWGAGATHGEAQHLGAGINLLVRDSDAFGEGVTTRILKRTGRRVVTRFTGTVDIEKLISLLSASGVDEFHVLAERVRRNYFDELRISLARAGLLDGPNLAVRLLRLHDDRKFSEEVESLSGVISTNHDGLMQIAFQDVYGGLNLGFPFVSKDFKLNVNVPPLLQLHGSFTWKFGVPTQVYRLQRGSRYSADTVWIPPTILKESKNYPFNKLSGLAYELLAKNCDVLRVVGASLTQNDWNILSLIFNAQRHRELTRGSAFRVELIMPHKVGEDLRSDCGYLKDLTPIGYLSEGRFEDYKTGNENSDMENPLEYWLDQKIEYHESRNEISAESSVSSGAASQSVEVTP